MIGVSQRGSDDSKPNQPETRRIPIVAQYCIRTVLLEHGQRLRSKYLSRPTTSLNDDARQRSSQKSASISSIAEIMNGYTNAKERKKFPKDLIKLLEGALQRVVMRQDPAYDEVQLRGSFAAFYSYYMSDAFQKTIKDNRKIEDLILMFFSKATGELQKRTSEHDVKLIVNQHVAKFVRLLLHVIKSNKLASPDSDLVFRLNEYESKLLRNAEVLAIPSLTINPKMPSTEHNYLPSKPYNIPALRCVQAVFSIDEASLQNTMEMLKDVCTEQAALKDLKIMLGQIQAQDNAAYSPDAFLDQAAYDQWRTGEVSFLTRAILKLSNGNLEFTMTGGSTASREVNRESLENPSERTSSEVFDITESLSSLDLLKSSNKSSSHDRSQKLTFIPSDPFNCYQKLLSACLTHEINMSQQSNVTDLLSECHCSLLSQPANELLALCRTHWRISPSAHKVAYIDVCKTRFVDGHMPLEDIDVAFADIKEGDGLCMSQSTKQLKLFYKQALLSLNDSLFRDLYAELQHVYTSTVDLQVLTVMDEHIYSDECFLEASDETAHMFDELEIGMNEVAGTAYRARRDELCIPANMEVLHVVKLADLLLSDAQRFRKRYSRPLLGVINLWSIFLNVSLTQFLLDLKALLEQCYRNARVQKVDFAIEDMFQLYHSVVQVHTSLHDQQPDFVSPINLDLYFRPFVLKWLQQAHSSITELVPRLIQTDNFEADEAVTENIALQSQSVMLLFKSFNQHLSYLRDLKWPDEYWASKFVTSLTQTFSSAIRTYCVSVQNLFLEECTVSIEAISEPLQTPPSTLQQRIITKAREAIHKREDMKPFHISRASCVKLNNIEWAKSTLDSLERSVDCNALTETIERFEGSRIPWEAGQRTLFTVKIVSAEGLTAGDTTGFSDAFVVLSDQKGKRVGKTRTIYTDLNSRWDERFDISTTEALWLAATVWNRDISGQHDICGRCYFKLDPRYFEDLVSKDFHINLDTQGVLHLKITMEVDLDESTSYFARAFRSLSRAESDMSRSIVDKMTPYINSLLSRTNLKSVLNGTFAMEHTIGSAYQLLNKAGFPSTTRFTNSSRDRALQLSNQEMEAPIEPLMQYLDDNFRTLDGSLTRSAFLKVMSKLWKHVLVTIENLIIPPLAASAQRQKRSLREDELDLVYKWLGFLKDTFSGDGGGLSEEELQTAQYHELLSIRFFYFDEVDELMRECTRMTRSSQSTTGTSTLTTSGTLKPFNLGTIKQMRDEKRAIRRQLHSSEDIILRILRLRGSADAQDFVNITLNERNEKSKQAVNNAGMSRISNRTSRNVHS